MSSAGFAAFQPGAAVGRDRHARGPVREHETKHQDPQGADDTLQPLPPDEAEFGLLEDQHADRVAGGHHSQVR